MGDSSFMLSCFSNPVYPYLCASDSVLTASHLCVVAAWSQRPAQNTSTLTRLGVMLQMGLGVAAEYVLEIGIEAIWQRVQQIAGMLRQQLHELKGVTVQDRGRLLCGIVSFTMVRLQSLSCQQTTVRNLWLAGGQPVNTHQSYIPHTLLNSIVMKFLLLCTVPHVSTCIRLAEL